MSVNVRDFSVKCCSCDEYQTLSGFERRGDIHLYRYECDNGVCDPRVTSTLIEVRREIDEFARRASAPQGG